MKKDEHERRLTYKNAKNQLEEEIAQLNERIEKSIELNDEDQEKFRQLEEQYEKVAERFRSQRLVLVEKKESTRRKTKTFRFCLGEEKSRNFSD